jgi:hypothetical protein
MVLAGGLLASTSAWADEYVCWTRYNPSASGGFGDNGYLLVVTYTGTACTGTFVSMANFCTTGATTSACSSTYLYPITALNTLNSMLQSATINNQKISVTTEVGNPSRGTTVMFKAN